eukprot:309937-Pyramimonas_sp.AAC.1
MKQTRVAAGVSRLFPRGCGKTWGNLSRRGRLNTCRTNPPTLTRLVTNTRPYSAGERVASCSLTVGLLVVEAMGVWSSSFASSDTSGWRFHTDTNDARKFRGSMLAFSAVCNSVLV